MLDELAQTGYEGTELGDWGYMPTDPAALHQQLDQRRLTMLGAFVPVALKDPSAHVPGEKRVLQVAQLLAAVHQQAGADTPPFLVLADENGADPARTLQAGRITTALGLTDAQWSVFAAGANRIAAEVKRRTGLRTVFHHHCAGYVESPDEIEMFLTRTDPGLVGLVFDTGHLAFGSGVEDGASVLQALDRFADRVWYVHLKDYEPAVAKRSRLEGWDYFDSVRHGVFCELGRGSVNFRGVIDWLRRRGYRGWVVVEQDVLPGMGSPKESALRNREYLRGLGI
jgi:inosose dehydratase